ncbi:MAG TPA: DUF5672 family protein, partial [Pseudosphingobacterium sp.]|nr:DUF5672 family protein [Pseudosphingobacterium sp.]
DVFWSIEINRRARRLKIPGYKRALSFSVESCPDYGISLLGNKMPFGCHGWDKNKEFWRPIFIKFGYLI